MFHHLDLTPGAVVIVIATPRMAKLAVRFGSDGPVFMDATHSMVKYDGFKLSTLMVLDETNAAEPVAWAIIQRETAEVYSTVLCCVKSAFEMHANAERAAGAGLWEFVPPCFLTDHSNAEINAVRCAAPSLDAGGWEGGAVPGTISNAQLELFFNNAASISM